MMQPKKTEDAKMQNDSNKKLCREILIPVASTLIASAVIYIISNFVDVVSSAHETLFSFLEWLQSLSPP
jgi:hypothetical protein